MLQTIIKLIKKFLGLEDKNTKPLPPTALEVVLKSITDAKTPEDKLKIIKDETQKAEKVYEHNLVLLKKAGANPYSEQELQLHTVLDTYATDAFGALQTLNALAAEHIKVGKDNPAKLDAERETGQRDKEEYDRRILYVLSFLGLPLDYVAKEVGKYIEHYEEPMFLAETRGDYKCGISLDRQWIKIPIGEFIEKGKATPGEAEKAQRQLFKTVPVIATLDGLQHATFEPTSFVDIIARNKGKRVVAIREDKLGWFLHIVTN